MSVAFSAHCKHVLKLDVCADFLELLSLAMARLQAADRSNVVYNLAKGIGTGRFPLERMPMGLVEYTVNFFIAESVNAVS